MVYRILIINDSNNPSESHGVLCTPANFAIEHPTDTFNLLIQLVENLEPSKILELFSNPKKE